MLELLSPAGSPEAVTAAVQNGADAVYMGFGDLNARRRAKNFTEKEFSDAVEYCRIRGVKTYLTLNTLLTDRELPEAAELIRKAVQMGVDAVLVQDLGVVRLVRQVAEELPIHASTQMTLHSLAGVEQAAAMGVSRAVLSRELSGDQLAFICRNSPIEIEVFVHGAHCMSYSGQCAMSALIGGRSGNRGLCAQPCRMPYGWQSRADSYPLSLKDMSLIRHLRELEEMGVACVKIEGRMKRPEYVAVVTGIYSRAIREKREPTREDLERLQAAFSRGGFTDGYFTGRKGPEMFGVRSPEEEIQGALLAEARATYANKENGRVPVRFYVLIRPGEPSKAAVEDEEGRVSTCEGPVPEVARTKALSEEEVKNQLMKSGGTPYVCTQAKALVQENLALPLSALNAMRRSCLEDLTRERARPAERKTGEFTPGVRYQNNPAPPVQTYYLQKTRQLSAELLALEPERIYLPVSEIVLHGEELVRLMQDGKIHLVAALPRILWDKETEETCRNLEIAYGMGVREALAENLGQLSLIRSCGMEPLGGAGLNVTNAQTLKELRHQGLKSAVLSFELRFAQIRDLSKCMDTELVVYGRLPLMVMENCIIKNRSGRCVCDNPNLLTDSTGAQFPVLPETGCRNVLYNSRKLFLADRAQDYRNLGLWGVRLDFTTENSQECLRTAKRYLDQGNFSPNLYTRGLYYRGVE